MKWSCTTSYQIILMTSLVLSWQHSVKDTLPRLLEDWRKALDNHESAAAVLMLLIALRTGTRCLIRSMSIVLTNIKTFVE